ncbi:MAG: type II/IV secretion system ATPase subunit [Candidatus Nanohaloarchaeota archaeon QJJ-7]|nr:type II/IV secretion system ATPase subunit [Candidatus Nanohaloarchaeota archaeon QJJ-7]
MARLKGLLHDDAVRAWSAIKDFLPLIGSEDKEEEDIYGEFQIQSASSDLVVVPESDDITEIDIRYPLLEPFADAHIYWDDDEEELIYEVEEPSLSEREKEIFKRAKAAMEKKISVPLSKLEGSEEIVNYLREEFSEVLKELGYHLNTSEENKLMYYIYRNFGGLNEIEPLMNDPYIEDIGCSGTDIPVYVIHTKFGSIKTDMEFESKDNLSNLVVKLAERANKYVSYSDPLLDGTLPDGSRVNASLTADVTTKGPTFSIRKFQEVPFSAVDLLDLGTVSSDIMAYMWMCLQYQKSGLIIGGTATGKTTFLNSIVSFIPPEMKITSIEDTRELQLPHQNWIPSVTRSSMGGEQENITMFELLRESFRQNPDYVVVGEVRGEEASVLFQGMASGHPSLSTMHASTPADVVSRLTTPPIDLSPALVETLDMIVSMTHAREWGENSRRVQAVYEIEDISDEGTARTNEYFSWTSVDDTFSQKASSTILDNIQQQYGLDEHEIQQELEDRKKVLEWLQSQGFAHFKKVSSVVSEYYKDKEKVMEMITADKAAGLEELVEEGEESMPSQIEQKMKEIEGAASAPQAQKGDRIEDESGTETSVNGNEPVDRERPEREEVGEMEERDEIEKKEVEDTDEVQDEDKDIDIEEDEKIFDESEMEENPFEQ